MLKGETKKIIFFLKKTTNNKNLSQIRLTH